MDSKRKIIAITPFICIIVFVLARYLLIENNLQSELKWTWLIFVLIPIMPYAVGIRKLYFTYPVLCVAIYLVLGLCFNLWHPGWIVFLTIPVYYILRSPRVVVERD